MGRDLTKLHVMLREREGREASPTAAIIDSQTTKLAKMGGVAPGERRANQPTGWDTMRARK